ncbi:right-handed parallel beta-helix repeat-containing protein [Leptolyngbya sp. 15MV]|nr:right-handed parallel beta-helix repeat-containing protein [Leptolyngbya sp. 15MV]
MHRSIFAIGLAVAATSGGASHAGETDCSISAFGAVADDGTDDTTAIQRAIDTCAPTGRRIVVPAGRFDVGHLRLRSGTDLYLAPNARLAASLDLADYPPLPAIGGHRAWIYGEGVENVSISGLGTFDGQAAPVYRMMDEIIARDRNDPRADHRVRFGLLLDRCRNTCIRDITITDTQMYFVNVRQCDDVVIDGITLRAPPDSHNTDGLQIDDSHDVRVTNCDIAVGDDAIVTKARTRGVERLLVNNCVISSDDGAIKFGTASHAGVRDSQFSNIVITDSRYGVALFMIHGGEYVNNRFSSIQIATGGRHPRTYPIFVDVDDRMARDPGHRLGKIDGLTFSGIDIRTKGNVLIAGHPGSPIRNLTLSGVRIVTEAGQPIAPGDAKPRGNRRFDPVPGSPDLAGIDASVVIGHAEGLALDQVTVRGEAQRPDFHIEEVIDLVRD